VLGGPPRPPHTLERGQRGERELRLEQADTGPLELEAAVPAHRGPLETLGRLLGEQHSERERVYEDELPELAGGGLRSHELAALDGPLEAGVRCASVPHSERMFPWSLGTRLQEHEYEGIRAVPTHSLNAPGHDDPSIERVLERHDRYDVSEKFGEPGAAFSEADPRS